MNNSLKCRCVINKSSRPLNITGYIAKFMTPGEIPVDEIICSIELATQNMYNDNAEFLWLQVCVTLLNSKPAMGPQCHLWWPIKHQTLTQF